MIVTPRSKIKAVRDFAGFVSVIRTSVSIRDVDDEKGVEVGGEGGKGEGGRHDGRLSAYNNKRSGDDDKDNDDDDENRPGSVVYVYVCRGTIDTIRGGATTHTGVTLTTRRRGRGRGRE